ncbi:unnamed protein product [Nezara viridula]|uniref:UBC core domain-containing protein n=1 Tax=Nezara viridula TaxID=85310 RepID=A0A9P0E9Z2_NEZVI|nr:unnamed protein product [Nezara viridula]
MAQDLATGSEDRQLSPEPGDIRNDGLSLTTILTIINLIALKPLSVIPAIAEHCNTTTGIDPKIFFNAHMKFPPDYPYSPPSIRFLTKVWHPNVYENGDLCISILHPPVDDPQSGELPCERWNPTQNVRKQVSGGRAEAEKDGVEIPMTLEDYCIKTRVRAPEANMDMTDFYVDDYDIEEDDDDEDISADEYEDADDSGNGES